MALREVQVDLGTRKKPKVVFRLQQWEYLERSLHRLLCGWGRHLSEWDDKIALARHVWEQAESVQRLRQRLVEFPGASSNLEGSVSVRLQKVGETVLHAPSWQDAFDGIAQHFLSALVKSYLDYAKNAHPVHDAPTLAVIAANVRAKDQIRRWLRDFRRRFPHEVDSNYIERIGLALGSASDFLEILPTEPRAKPIGVESGFRPPLTSAHPKGSRPKHDIMPHLESAFSHSIEVRRLFWCYGYMLELNLAEDQLIWLWDSHELPWEFQYDVSRHMWDESRHGDSGHSRLLDFGISLEEIGFPHYTEPSKMTESCELATGESNPMGPKELYEAVFFIGMVAETGHFQVKQEAYEDFKSGGDLESAEMMLFDIIDETSHVQYAHHWLPMLAERAGIHSDDWRIRGAETRRRLQKEAVVRAQAFRPTEVDEPARAHVQQLLERMRQVQPLSNAQTCPPRSYKPM
jgi:hypothetical protein